MSGLRLNVGCGGHVVPGWINIDPHPVRGVVFGHAARLPVCDESAECIIMFDVVEHMHPLRELPAALAEVKRVLQPGGVLRVSTPDLKALATAYVEGRVASFGAASQPRWYVDPDTPECLQFSAHAFANNADTVAAGLYEGHQAVYDEPGLGAVLAAAGFKEVQRQRPLESLSETIRLGVRDRWPDIALIMEAVKWT